MAGPGPDGRRGQILEAARRCLATHGYDKTTMADVGREVGLNKASLYYYFPNKESLVAQVVASEGAEYMEELQRRVESATGCRERITTYLVERYRLHERLMNLHNLSIQDLRQVAPHLKTLFQDCRAREIEFIRSILDYCASRNELPPCDTGRVAAAIMLVADGYKMEAINNPDTPPGAPVDYSGIEGDVVYTVSLMLDGLQSEPKK